MVISSKLDFKIILSQSGWRLGGLLLVSSLVYVAKRQGIDQVSIDSLPASILGTALSILLGFKITSAYTRWLDARKLWGAISNDSRALVRQLNTLSDETFPESERLQKIMRRQIAYALALKNMLRNCTQEELIPFIDTAEYAELNQKPNFALYLLSQQSQEVSKLRSENKISEFAQIKLEEVLTNLNASQGACERLKTTGFPNTFSLHLNLFIILYSYLLPFVLIGSSDWHTIPAAVIIGYVFFSLSTIAKQLEDPFENQLYDVPMNSICRSLETNLLQISGSNSFRDPVVTSKGHLS